MPGFPKEDIQRQFSGASNEQTLRGAYDFYQIIKKHCSELGNAIRPESRVLDFGCGWGRITRFFFKDLPSENILGVDIDPDMVAFCSSEMQSGKYFTVKPEPPMPFEDDSLSVIFAFSVFSHLSEPVAKLWIREFSRILKPNGVLIATTEGRSFLDFCQSLHDKQEELDFGWFKALANSFQPIEDSKRKYDAGEFLYSATGGGGVRDKSFYGETLIPRNYIENEYTQFLSLKDFVDDRQMLPQAYFVMQKK